MTVKISHLDSSSVELAMAEGCAAICVGAIMP
jgi:hypothetical protein